MPPPLLIDLSQVDLTKVLHAREEIYDRLLPHKYEFELLDGVCMLDRATKSIIVFADIGVEDWWVRGHVPGQPLLPGVLMLEMAAQASAIGTKLLIDYPDFIAFGGVDACKFRGTVTPPARLHILCRATEIRARRTMSDTQGVVEGRFVFEARITGLTFR